MLILYFIALAGIVRYRAPGYWKWVSILLVWMIGAELLFAAGGTLQDPTGDGLITRQIRIATNDGPGMGTFAIAFLVVFWGAVIWMLRKLYVTGRQAEQERELRKRDTAREASWGRKLIEAGALTLAMAAYMYFGTVAPLMETQTPTSARADQAEGSDPVARDLAQLADELTNRAPEKLDSVTTLVGVSAEGRTLTYHFEISQRDGTDDQVRSFARENAVAQACDNPDLYEGMKEHGLVYRYSYKMPDTDLPVVVAATYDECRSLGVGG
jgi:hypothetical protein